MPVYLISCPNMHYKTGLISLSEIPKLYLICERLIQLHPTASFYVHYSNHQLTENVATEMATYIEKSVSIKVTPELDVGARKIFEFVDGYSDSANIEIGIGNKNDLKSWKPEINWHNGTLWSSELGLINYYERLVS